MTDTGELLSTTSSLEDLSILELDPDGYKELADTTPAVAFIDDDLQVIPQSLENEEEDLSDYVRVQADDHKQLPPSQPFLQPTSSYSDSISPESVSPSSIFSPSTTSSFEDIYPDLFLETTEDVDLAIEGSHKDLSEIADKRWNSIFSSALKEEIRYKIQLKRLNSGQEELKVDFPAPDTTICYEAVKKRNEVRQKNIEYAKQSRDRVKLEKMKVEQANKRLKQKNAKLKKDIIRLKQITIATKDVLCQHHTECPVCCKAGNTCLICSKEPTRTSTEIKASIEPVNSTFIGLKRAHDFDPEPGPSGLSNVKSGTFKPQAVNKSEKMIFWVEHKTQDDKQHLKVLSGKPDTGLPSPKVKFYEDSLASTTDQFETR
ncbi:hypothetical protein BsWGS_20941 [Bradybaena similaris]